MTRIRLHLMAAMGLALGASVAAGQALTQVSQAKAVSGASITASYVSVPLDEALRDVAVRAHAKINFPDGRLPAGVQVTQSFTNVSTSEAFSVLLRGTKLRAVQVSTGDWVVVPAAGQKTAQGVIMGKVSDAHTSKGISGANVSVEGNKGVTTGEDGTYRIAAVNPGAHTVTVRLVGYAKQTRRVTMGEDATVTVDFKLEPSANVLDQVIVTGTVVSTELRAVPNAITVITAKQIEDRGITRIDQLFRGDIPGLFAVSQGSASTGLLDEVLMYSRGATALRSGGSGVSPSIGNSNPIKTYIDGVELADPKYLSQIDPKSIERIEVISGPQASTIYGSNAINGVMQIFTRRGSTSRPQLNLNLQSGWVENNFSQALVPQHDYSLQLSGIEGRLSYSSGGSWNYIGPWTPAKHSTRTGAHGGVRLDLPTRLGQSALDLTLRRDITRNVQGGSIFQTAADFAEAGWYVASSTSGLATPTEYTLTGQTLGLTFSYAPTSWWSHELGIGSDISDTEQRTTARGYIFGVQDTLLLLAQSHADRRSQRYTTTARIPVTSIAQLTVTAGADAWQNVASSLIARPLTLTGSLSGSTSVTRQPGHNFGEFVQTQIALADRLFLTYGLRAEWNPNYGDAAEPNIAPRYGMAYTYDLKTPFGALTTKLRGSYGRSTRPPAPNLKAGQSITDYIVGFYGDRSLVPIYFESPYGSVFSRTLPNPELGPEYQQGGEGGLELYLGNRGSLVVTRYNQTVDGLIVQPVADSIRTLAPCPGDVCFSGFNADSFDPAGYAYYRQYQYLNIGSIRNQGWELQGSVNAGPLTTRGTYSWTKSRTIGIDRRYRSSFVPNAFPQYQPGATAQYLPEHTWAIGTTYANGASTVALTLSGIGRALNQNDDFYFHHLSSDIRLQQNRFNVSSVRYVNFNSGNTLADINASHRFAARIEGVLQVQNLANNYTNNFSAAYASLGRQSRLGLRIRL